MRVSTADIYLFRCGFIIRTCSRTILRTPAKNLSTLEQQRIRFTFHRCAYLASVSAAACQANWLIQWNSLTGSAYNVHRYSHLHTSIECAKKFNIYMYHVLRIRFENCFACFRLGSASRFACAANYRRLLSFECFVHVCVCVCDSNAFRCHIISYIPQLAVFDMICSIVFRDSK